MPAPSLSPTLFRDELRDSLGVLIERYAGIVMHERGVERAMLEEAAVNKTPLPNNYWLPRMKAEQHLKAAMAMMEATLE